MVAPPSSLLDAVEKHPAMQHAQTQLARLKRILRPVAPILTRALLVSTFVEDALRTLLEYRDQTRFLRSTHSVPTLMALLMILSYILCACAGSAFIFIPPISRIGAHLLLACTVYQQVLYGRHSPITAGNLGFFVRNACLIGTLALLLSRSGRETASPADDAPSLPGIRSRAREKTSADAVALAARVMLALLALEMFDVIGWGWALVVLPIAAALLVGYKTELMGLMLIMFYALATVLTKQFWRIGRDSHHEIYQRDVMRYEFLQTISILSGLFVLVMSGPGALSLDDKIRNGKAF